MPTTPSSTQTVSDTCSLVLVSSNAVQVYGNVLACRNASATTRIGITETSASTEVQGLKNNAFVGIATLMVHDGGTNISSINLLNNLSTVPSAKRGGNFIVSTFANLLFKNVSNNDFSLLTGSALIDKSLNTSDPALGSVTSGFLGHARPCGSGYDVGAYEYCP